MGFEQGRIPHIVNSQEVRRHNSLVNRIDINNPLLGGEIMFSKFEISANRVIPIIVIAIIIFI